MTDVIEGNADQSSPETLDAEALTPATEENLEQAVAERQAMNIRNAPKAKRGRPKGSTTKKASGRVVPPRTPKAPPTPNKAQEKKRKAEAYERAILEGLNEQIVTAISAMGVPASLLYAPGYVPPAVKEIEAKYSPLAQPFIIQPMQAKIYARAAAEWTSSDTPGRVQQMVEDGPLPKLLFTGLAGVFAFAQVRGAVEVLKKLQPFIAAAQEQRQAQGPPAQHVMPPSGPTHIDQMR